MSTAAPQLIDLHIDMSYTQKLNQFRMIVDKQDQGRALILNNVLKDSNNESALTFNTTGLAAGIYTVRIEALPPRGDPIPDGWMILEVQVSRAALTSSSRNVTMGGVLTTRRVASVPLTPTSTRAAHEARAPRPRGRSEYSSENMRRARIQPTPLAPTRGQRAG